MILAARLREALGAAGHERSRETVPFRDKERMKEVLDAAGMRTPRHFRAKTADGVREAAERVGYPVMRQADRRRRLRRHLPRRRRRGELEGVLPAHAARARGVSVEEFIEGEEYTFDTICADGQILY